jgi:heme A synthase
MALGRAVLDLRRFHRFTHLVLLSTLVVIVWGGYVRATGSGAGCGNHWPTCNGQILPRSPSAKTVVEFAHRLSSGLAFLLVFAQMVWSLRLFPRRHEVRLAAVLVFVLMIVEALVGAGLVIFEMVAGNTAIARAYWMAAHLLNTFALLASMALVGERAARARDGEGPSGVAVRSPARGDHPAARLIDIGMVAVVVVAMSGAVAALGDTLFPSGSLAEGFAQDLSPGAHWFIRLRVVHPVAAAITALVLLGMGAWLAARDPGALRIRRAASTLAGLVVLQVVIGITNLALLAPTSVQLIHLLTADVLWLALLRLRFAVHASDREFASGASSPDLAEGLAEG